jgi:hypothetical protein
LSIVGKIFSSVKLYIIFIANLKVKKPLSQQN